MDSFYIPNDFSIIACRNGSESARVIYEGVRERFLKSREILKAKESSLTYDKLILEYYDYILETDKIVPVDVEEFSDGEVRPSLEKSIRSKDVYIVQNAFNPSNPKETSHNLVELYVTLDSVKRSSPKSITVIEPYFSYSKQERRQGRQPISAKLFVDFLEKAGANNLLTLDLHAPAIEGFTSGSGMNIENIYASPVFRRYLSSINFKGTYAAPDSGAAKTVAHYSKVEKRPLILGYKIRFADSKHTIDSQGILGDCEGEDVAIIDDQIATGGTLVNAASIIKNEKHAKSVRLIASHGLFLLDSENKFRKAVEEGVIGEVVITNSFIHSKDFLSRNPYVKVLNALDLCAGATFELQMGGSLSRLYDEDWMHEIFGKKHRI